ncbi:MAG: PEP-CTERM sorting domain-containing protein, partial [Stellaceae bacterium]
MAALLVFAVGTLLARGAFAETLWLHPDRDPFQGTLAGALDLFAAHGIPRQILQEQQRLYAAGRCVRRRIGNGEHIALMTFGSNRVLPDVVAEVSLWPGWAPRDATLCRVAAQGSTYALVRPDVCGNWSEERLPPSAGSAPAAPAAVEVPDANSGLWPEAVGMSGTEGGSESFLSPAGFIAPAAFSDGSGGDAPDPVGLVVPAVLPDGPAGDLPSPTGFVVPAVSPDLPEEGYPSPKQPTPTPPGSPPANVPEPASGLLFGSALAVFALTRRALHPQRAERGMSAAEMFSWRDT